MPRVRNITLDGVTMSISDWARHTGLSNMTISKRLAAGWDIERALSAPLNRHKDKVRLDPHEVRRVVHAFACDMRRQIDQFEQEIYEQLDKAAQ